MPELNFDGSAWKIQKRVFCDVAELFNLPLTPSDWPEMQGQSKKQIDYGKQIRATKLGEWKRDLPQHVYGALETIADSGWWITHKNVSSSGIGYPEQWTKVGILQPGEFECPHCHISRTDREKCQNPACEDNAGKLTQLKNRRIGALDYYFNEGDPESKVDGIPSGQPPQLKDLAEFDAFARKAAMSPELAYLTIMALFYRYTGDHRVAAKFGESRQKVQKHLDAIDQILGSPGAEL